LTSGQAENLLEAISGNRLDGLKPSIDALVDVMNGVFGG
jgi:hypothetical protein